MRQRSALALGAALLLLLTGCSVVAGDASPTPTSTPAPVSTEDAAAAQQAEEWVDAVVAPPGAVRVEEKPTTFNFHQGWPCQPAVQRKAYWTVADTTVAAATSWVRDNPPDGLVSTAGPIPEADDPAATSSMLGFIPADESHQGIVLTIVGKDTGVAIRAEVAALTASATCPSLPPGSTLGKPGQG